VGDNDGFDTPNAVPIKSQLKKATTGLIHPTQHRRHQSRMFFLLLGSILGSDIKFLLFSKFDSRTCFVSFCATLEHQV
jgi:hypothetical protein